MKIILPLSFLFLFSCSASYEKLSKESFNPPTSLSKHLMEAYKTKADFEAQEMHDWNSAKLYAEKALGAADGKDILPEKISYWVIPADKQSELNKAYNNLMTVYKEALLLDPFNLAKAISSLDCWAEQQEENWQTWDIDQCRNDFLSAMHEIFGSLEKEEGISTKQKINNEISKLDDSVIDDSISIVTKNSENKILQIIYFDFDKSKLSDVSIEEIKNFINANKKTIKKFIVVGHTDTMGTKKYNKVLSLERAEVVQKVLTELGIEKNNIHILGKGEDNLRVQTADEVKHPANRRAEISPLN
ncbi:MAG: OmpA family protein [Alphaproteobacteria bacterium]|jgi:OOP family OmpA-OmpF porin|nr:OmpA family protein [Alphaproteobacteria bacterium]PPR57044.1 MAG: Outer membrane porin F [Alphaproteobacteria bacterium MarineAlpha5_Bin3]